MIIMKKVSKIIIPFIILIIIITSIIIITNKRNTELSIIVPDKHYSLLYEDKPILNLKFYCSKDDPLIFDLNNISKASIYNEYDMYNCKIEEIIKSEDLTNYQNKDYYEGIFKIILNFTSNELIDIKNAYLKIIYNNEDELNIKIGNLCFYKSRSVNNITIKKVQSIVNPIDQYLSMVGIILEIEALSDLEIVNIIPISSSLKINNKYVKVNHEILDYDNNMNIKEIVGNGYLLFSESSPLFTKIIINEKERIQLIIPFSYQVKELVDNCGLIIRYKINGEIFEQIVNPYKLFNSSTSQDFLYEYRLSKNSD